MPSEEVREIAQKIYDEEMSEKEIRSLQTPTLTEVMLTLNNLGVSNKIVEDEWENR